MTISRRTFLSSFVFTACVGLGAAHAASADDIADFFRAVDLDDVRGVQALLAKGVSPNQVNPNGGEPALVSAAREGSMKVLAALLAHPGTEVDAQAFNGNTALMLAAFKRNMAAVQALLAKGAAVNRSGWTPLHYAAASGDNEIALLLLRRGASVDAVSPLKSGSYTPLMMAAREGHDITAKLLIDHGADPGRTNSEGLTAVELAERAGRSTAAASIAQHAARR